MYYRNKPTFRVITLKYDGHCKKCGAALAAGEKAIFLGSGRVYCVGGKHKNPVQTVTDDAPPVSEPPAYLDYSQDYAYEGNEMCPY